MRKILLAELFCMLAITVQAQFVTIMGETETVVNDTVSTDFNPTDQYEFDEEDDDEDDTVKKKRRKGIGRLFDRIGKWIGLKKDEAVKDTVPIDPTQFSYDKVEGNGSFIFTEADERKYLDSIKYELIKRRYQVLKRKSMVSMPMDQLKATSYFGYRKDPFTKAMKFHNGIDFAAHDNFVYAVLPGLVVYAGYRGGYGYCVELKHGDIHTLYAHLSYILVKRNQPVPAGEPIGISGTTGRSTGEHLHFSIMNKGKYIDPVPMLDYLSSILAEEQPTDEEFFLPSYQELKDGGSDKEKPVVKDMVNTPKEATMSQDTVPSKRTSGMMLVAEDEKENTEGEIHIQGQNVQSGNSGRGNDGDPRIHYIDKKKEETDLNPVPETGGIIHYSGKAQQSVTMTKPSKTGESDKTDEIPQVPKPKSGIILPVGDSVVSVKPLTRN